MSVKKRKSCQVYRMLGPNDVIMDGDEIREDNTNNGLWKKFYVTLGMDRGMKREIGEGWRKEKLEILMTQSWWRRVQGLKFRRPVKQYGRITDKEPIFFTNLPSSKR